MGVAMAHPFTGKDGALTKAVIRRARIEDAGDLHRHCYPEASLDDVQDYLAWCLAQEKKGRIVRLVAEVDGQAAGNAQLTVWDRVGEIGSVIVADEHRRRGLARQLITTLIDEARGRGLDSVEISVHESQPAILAFYRRLGFEPVGKQKNGPLASAGLASPILLRMRLRGEQRKEVPSGKLQSTTQNDSGCDDLLCDSDVQR